LESDTTTVNFTPYPTKQPLLTSANAGSNITIDTTNPLVPIINSNGETANTDYGALSNKPKINSIELSGDKTNTQLNLAGLNDITVSNVPYTITLTGKISIELCSLIG
jgi:hypothetical protein